MSIDEQLLNQVSTLAGSQRATSFRAAAAWCLEHNAKGLVETGCYRGIGADGQSTLIMAMLAKRLGTVAESYDLNQDHVKEAQRFLFERDHSSFCRFAVGDSVEILSGIHSGPIDFLYLDSFDHDPKNPGPCQRHQLAELGAAWGVLSPSCAILLDDNDPKTGGKCLLSGAFLSERGFKLVSEGMQKLFIR